MLHFQPQPGWVHPGVREGVQHPVVSTEWLEGQCCPPGALLARLQDRARLWSGGCGANRAPHAMLAPWLAVPLCAGYHQRYHKTQGDTGGQLSLAFPTVGCSPPWSSPAFLHPIFL